MKPYLKLAWILLAVGSGLILFERFGLPQLTGNGRTRLDGTLLSILVIVPVVLIIAGCVVFMVGKMRRL